MTSYLISGYSNKEEVLELPDELVAHYIGGCAALRPKIDRLALTLDIPQDDQEGIYNNLKENSFNPKGAPLEQVLAKKSSSKSGYYLSVQLPLHEIDQAVLLEAKPKKPAAFLRLEMNPALLEKGWTKHLHKRLSTLLTLQYGWPYVFKNAKVTRLDVAIDLLGVRTSNILLDQRSEHPKLMRQLYVGQTGELQSLYLFQKSAQHPKALAYDKRVEMLKKNKEPPYGSVPHTRIELRLKPEKLLSELNGLPNPLQRFRIQDISKPIAAPKGKPNWAFFVASCQMSGVERAAATIPSSKLKNAYRKTLQQADRKVWASDEIWSQWTSALVDAELLKPELKQNK